MKAKLFVGILVYILMIFSIGAFSQEINNFKNIFPLEQVKHGMTGYGYSDFGPDVPNTFKFRVTSIERGSNGYGHDVIWALLYGNPKLKDGGVIAGMSGSPVYSEDGRFVGTVSYGWSNSIEPKAGITPAKDVLLVGESGLGGNFLYKDSNIFNQRDNDSRLSLMCFNINGGLSKYDDLNRLFAIKPFFSGSSGSESQMNFADGLKVFSKTLKPGDSISVGLVVGDITVAGAGTVSYVDGENVWIFGHPMFQMGPINFPMLSAKTDDVTLLRTSSFKEVSTGEIIGTFTQDRLTGVYGHLGQMPDMIPMTINLDRNGKKEILHFYIVRQNLLVPKMTQVIIGDLLTEFSDLQKLSIFSKGEICIQGTSSKSLYFSKRGEDLISKIKDYYSTEIKFALEEDSDSYSDNGKNFTHPRIESINIDLSVSEDSGNIFSIQKIKINPPNKPANVNYSLDIFLKNSQESIIIRIPLLKVPSDFNGEINILVGDAETMKDSDKNNSDNFSDFKDQEGILYIQIIYKTPWMHRVINTETHEIVLGNIFVQGQKSANVNLKKIK